MLPGIAECGGKGYIPRHYLDGECVQLQSVPAVSELVTRIACMGDHAPDAGPRQRGSAFVRSGLEKGWEPARNPYGGLSRLPSTPRATPQPGD